MQRPASAESFHGAEKRKSLRNALKGRLRDAVNGFGNGFDIGSPKAASTMSLASVQSTQEKEYWSWTRKLKKDGEPHFRMPYNKDAGAGGGEAKAHEMIYKMKEKEGEYNRWLQKISDELSEDVEKRLAQDFESAKKKKLLQKERAANLEEARKNLAEDEKEYWIQIREKPAHTKLVLQSSAPPKWNPGEQEQRAMAFSEDDHKRWVEYSKWVNSIRKPTGLIPKIDSECLTASQRDALINTLASKKLSQGGSAQAQYHRWLSTVNEKIKESTAQRLAEQKQWREEAIGGERAIAARTAELVKEQERANLEHKQFVEHLHVKAKSTPLLFEESQLPGLWAKRHPHRLMATKRRRETHDASEASPIRGLSGIRATTT
eukprot:TRINITY_DN25816_c0_g1_i1.p1 TRINITY_DN25816_c0_g1~~TRINITY_DN25816_c0_g1_i1.p1  ORF type:complete len:376 (+),score=85.32 TRINITY_DN25816_c0_g1_i1:65-1192(+)